MFYCLGGGGGGGHTPCVYDLIMTSLDIGA